MGGLSVLLLIFGLGVTRADWTETLSNKLSIVGISEDAAVGTYVGHLNYCCASVIIYSTTSELFDVNSYSGEVSLKKKLNYRADNSSTIIFTAKIDSTQEFPNRLILKVLPVNHPPSFDSPTYTTSIKDNAPVGSAVYNLIIVTDTDDGANGSVQVACNRLFNAQAQGICSIFTVTGVQVPEGRTMVGVTLAQVLNSSVMSYDVPLVASDFGTPPLNQTANLRVIIENSLDSRPIFTNSPFIATIPEFSGFNTVLFTVQVRDARGTAVGNSLKLDILDDIKGWLRLGQPQVAGDTYSFPVILAGNISLKGNNNNRKYTFNLKTTQLVNGQPTQVFSETSATVNIQDVNDNTPTFDKPSYSANISEGVTNGATVPGVSLIVTDDDMDDNAYFELSLTIFPSPSGGIFGLSPLFGQGIAAVAVIVNKPEYLRYDNPNLRAYTIVVTARETKTVERRSSSATVYITVTSLANHPPYFPNVLNPITVLDNTTVGTIISSFIRARDDDVGEFGRLKYSIASNTIAYNYFSIDENTGILILKSPLNSTFFSNIQVPVTATDGGGLSATMFVRIDILDYRRTGPQFAQSFYNTSVLELQTNLFPPVVVKAAFISSLVSDRVIMYRFTSDLPTKITEIFKINGTTGNLTMTTGVDYNDTPNRLGYFDLTVEAYVVNDDRTPPTRVTCRVYITDTNNHAPYFYPVNETLRKSIKDSTPPLTLIFTLTANDSDPGVNGQVNYLILMGGQNNFIIEYFTGILRVAQNPKLIPDTTYNITVIAVDGGQPQLTGTTNVYVTIIDSITKPPQFGFIEYVFYVTEGTAAGQLVGSARATSPDRRAIISYTFLPTWQAYDKNNQRVNADVSNWFSVSSTTADITVYGNIVYATAVKVTVTILARVTNPDPDLKENPSTNVSVTFLILPLGSDQDKVVFSPVTDIFYTQIYEQLPVNTVVFQFAAFYMKTLSPINNYYFYNQSVNGNLFTLDGTTGILTINQVFTYSQINPTKNITYYLFGKAPPPSTALAGANVVVNILPLSGNNPIFSQSEYIFYVMSNDPEGRVIGVVKADPPRPYMGLVFYSLSSFSPVFNVDSATGNIILLRRLDTLNSPQLMYTIFVFARLTNGSNTYTSNAVVKINVTAVKLQPPQFLKPLYYFLASPNPQNFIGQVMAFDPDPFSNSPVRYAIVYPAGFSIDPTTGVISSSGAIPPQTYVLNVSATINSGSGLLVSYVPVTVDVPSSERTNITISPDNPMYYVNIDKSPADILGISVSGTGASPSYSLISFPPEFGNFFSITNGQLRYNGNLANISQIITLTVAVSDGAYTVTRQMNMNVYSDADPTFVCKTQPVQVYVVDATPPQTDLRPSLGVTIGTPCSYNKIGSIFYYAITGISVQPIISPVSINNSTGTLVSNVIMRAYESDGVTLTVVVARNASDVTNARFRPNTSMTAVLRFTGSYGNPPTFNASNTRCQGVGYEVKRGLLDLTSVSIPVAQMLAGSCNMPGFRSIVYNIQTISFQSYVNQPGNNNEDERMRLQGTSFAINVYNAEVFTNLDDYRTFSNGWFDVMVRASYPTKSTLDDVTSLKIFVLRERQMMRMVILTEPNNLRNISGDLIKNVNNQLGPGYEMIGDVVTSYVAQDGTRNQSLSSMCYFVLRKSSEKYVEVVGNKEEIKEIIDKTALERRYGVSFSDVADSCYPTNATTKWWSDKWFLWFILIAFSILVFVVALILTCCVCLYWPMSMQGINKARPYVVLDNQMSSAGSAMGDRW